MQRLWRSPQPSHRLGCLSECIRKKCFLRTRVGLDPGRGGPRRLTSPYSVQKRTDPIGHQRLPSVLRLDSQSPADGHRSTVFLYYPRNTETPQGDTEAGHPGEAGGSSGPPRLCLPSQAQGWAPGTRPGESREEPHTHLLAGLTEGGREPPLLRAFSPRRAVRPKPPLHAGPGSQDQNLGTSTEGSGPLRGLRCPAGTCSATN